MCVSLALLAPRAASAQWLELDVPARPEPASAEARAELVEAGRQVYEAHCWYCHGAEGDGAGPIAETLWPRPRDFRIASFKLRTTPSGELPTDEDLFRTVTLGSPGTAMPAWGSVLSVEERWQVIAYVKAFGDGIFEDEDFDPYATVVDVGWPPPGSPESLAEAGRQVFERSDCWECHGQLGRGDGPKADRLTDDWGLPMRATDLEMAWKFRGGSTPMDAYLRLTTGLDGTPMPSYAQTLNDEERWQAAYYVASLASPPRADGTGSAVIRAARVKVLPPALDDEAWREAPTTWIPLTGQGTFPPRWQIPSVTDLAVQALYDADAVVLRLRWDDPTADSVPGDPGLAAGEGWNAASTWPVVFPDGERRRGTYRDELEVLFPSGGEGPALPHFVFGDARHSVDLWRWAAGGAMQDGERPVEELRASGVEAPPTPLPAEGRRTLGRASWQDGRWTVTLRRPLEPRDELRPGVLVPVAFHVRDGGHGETGLRMSVSSWYFLHLGEPVGVPQLAWVLLAVLATAAAELALVRLVRGRATRGELRRYGLDAET
jgi:mono/diheme cytochrome c family protein